MGARLLLVDEKTAKQGTLLRAPLVVGRGLWLSDDGFTLRFGGGARDAVLHDDGGLQRLGKTKKGGLLTPGEAFKIGRHPFRLLAGDDPVVDAHRDGDVVVFNCFHAVGDVTAWRAFRVDDDARALLDWSAGRATPSSFGVPLPTLGLARGATVLSATLARSVIDAQVRAIENDEHVEREAITLTWQGTAHVSEARPFTAGEDHLRESARVQAVLLERQLRGGGFDVVTDPAAARRADIDAYDALAAAPLAPPDELAALLRQLCPAAWADEQAVRARVADLDVAALTR